MDTYLTRVTDYLLTQSWQISLLVVVIAAVSLVLRNKSAHVRYLLWLIVLAKCLVPPLLTVPVAILPQEKPAMLFEVVGTTISETLELPSEPVKLTPAPIVRERPTKLTIRQWLGAGWMVGITVFLVFNFLKAVRTNYWLWRKRKALSAELLSDIENLFSAHGIKSSPGVWQIDGISQPFVWGLLRGSIYLPAELLNVKAPKRCRNLLGHELSHIIRFDAAVNFLQVIVQAIFWFHPFAWWANSKIRQEREKCCDEMAIARLNASPRDYSTAIVETLVAKYESTRPVPSLAVAGPVKNIEERIKTMLRPGKKFYKRPSLVAATLILLVALLTVPTAIVLTARAETKAATEAEEKPAESLHQAASDGDIEQVKLLISKGADVNAKDDNGWTPLHLALMNEDEQVAKLLIANGADANVRDAEGLNGLHWAVMMVQKEPIELLIAKGANIQARDNKGWTPLHHAAAYGQKDIARLLLDRGADVNATNKDGETPLDVAAMGMGAGVADLLVVKGAKVSTFHAAALLGDVDKVNDFITTGADVNSRNSKGGTPLHAAANGGQEATVKLLIAKGADVNAKMEKGATPLNSAAYGGHGEVVRLLIANGADVNANADKGWTPLHDAARVGHKDVAAIILANGADIHAKNKYGITPLRLAAGIGHQEVAELLVTEGADVNLADNYGWTPLHWAAKGGHRAITELLLAKGADLNAKKYDGGMPLHSAASEGQRNTVELLIAKGARVNEKDKQDHTPSWYAKDRGHKEIVELLRKHGAKE